MNREAITNKVSETVQKVIVDGTAIIPFVKPDVQDVVSNVNSLSNNLLSLKSPKDFFDERLLVETLDRAAKDYTRNAQIVAGASGGATGTIGIAGIIVDVPILIAATVGMVRRQALVYGFTEIEENEGDRIPLLLAVGAAIGADIAISQVSKTLAIEGGVRAAVITIERYLAGKISEELAAKIVLRWIPRAIPIISAFTGAALDAWFLNMAGKKSADYFRERHLLIRKQVAAIGNKKDEAQLKQIIEETNPTNIITKSISDNENTTLGS